MTKGMPYSSSAGPAASERLDKLASDLLGEAFCADWHDDPDKGVREVDRIKKFFVNRLMEFACDEIARDRSRAQASSEALPSANAARRDTWQPIETAPKDGAFVDLWSASRGRLVNCKWVTVSYTHDTPWGWVSSTVGRITDATHWQPLPSPPILPTVRDAEAQAGEGLASTSHDRGEL